jgi:hypothetical protein
MDYNKIIMSFMSTFEQDKMNYVEDNFYNIPDIIDNKTDKEIWDMTFTILNLYMNLVTDTIINDVDIEMFIDDWVFLFNELKKKCDDPTKVMLISIYINAQYENLLEWCVNNEYYEGAYNLKKINELL